jgi:hypothetical protein
MHSRVIKMSVTELLQAVRFLVDKDGNKTAAVLEYTLWEKLLTLLEDFEDAEEVQRLRESVIIFRLRDMRPDTVNQHVLGIISQQGRSLDQGSIISVTEGRIRLRPLPIGTGD